jgi:transmembrane sensor
VTRRRDHGDLDLAAAGWAVRIERGLSPRERAELDAWSGDDLVRQGALVRALAVLASLEALEPATPLAAAPDRRPPHRRELMFGGAVAAGVGGVAFVGMQRNGRGAIYATVRGQRRVATLEDGSRVWLNTASRVQVRFTPGRREVQLLNGEALFDVAHDPRRPFVVRSGVVDVRAVGTSFSVSQFPDAPLEIMVREGRVDVGADAPGAPPPTRLIPGCRAHATQAGDVSVVHVGVPTVLRALAWRSGILDFQAVPLAEAARRFGRYADPQIRIDDPVLANQIVSGQFAANDPATFARTVAAPLGLRVRRSGRALYLER